QVGAAEAAVECPYGRPGQQIAGGAVAVEVDAADDWAERRSSRVGEVDSQFKSPGHVHHAGKIRYMRVIRDKRPGVLLPVVEVEPGAVAARGRVASGSRGAGIAREGVGAEHLIAASKAPVGA